MFVQHLLAGDAYLMVWLLIHQIGEYLLLTIDSSQLASFMHYCYQFFNDIFLGKGVENIIARDDITINYIGILHSVVGVARGEPNKPRHVVNAENYEF